MNIDPSIIPWSCRGSWFCLATRAGENGTLTPGNDLYLVSHNYGFGLPLFAIRPHLDGALSPPSGFHRTPSAVTWKADPSQVAWMGGENVVAEATYSDERSLRLRGTRALSFDTEGALKVDHWRCWIFQVPPARGEDPGVSIVEFTSLPNTAFRFTSLRGRLEVVNGAPYDSSFEENNRRVTISSTDSAPWELLIEERDPQGPLTGSDASQGLVYTSGPPRRPPFDEQRERQRAAFERYAADLTSWSRSSSASVQQLDVKAAFIMWTSTVRPGGYIPTEAVLMSKLWMNKVWSWDNCFNGLALASLSLDRALEQILLPFRHITPEGRLPDSITRSEILYDYTKPPIYGWTFFKLLQLLDPTSSESEPNFTTILTPQLHDVYSKVSAFTRFWFTHRSTHMSAIPYYSHGNDSGWDNATCFDRQTVAVSPDLAALLVSQCDFLAKLGRFLGDEGSAVWEQRRQQVLDGLMHELWDEQGGRFRTKDALNGSTWASQSLLNLLPLVSAVHLPPRVVDRLEVALEAHLTEWGLATEAIDSPLYEADGYWRGPIWAPPTILIVSGLREVGRVDSYKRIVERFFALCDKGGFAENYDAKTGDGNRDLSYTWSASTYLVLRREYEALRR